jgi:hypothetical protein
MVNLLKGRIRLSTILLMVFFALTLSTYIMVRPPNPDHPVSNPDAVPTTPSVSRTPSPSWSPHPSARPSSEAPSRPPSPTRTPSPGASPHATSSAEEPPASGSEGD